MKESKKARLGQRWICFSCGAKFYDLNKPEPICPRCQADQRQSPALEKPKRGRKAARKAARKAPPPKAARAPLLAPEEEAISQAEVSLGSGDVPELDLEGAEELGEVEIEGE